MSQKTITILVVVVVGAIMLATTVFFRVNEAQTAIVLQFGKSVAMYNEPGLKVKLPFIQEVEFFDRRLLDFTLPAIEINAGDQKRMVADLYIRYKITDPLLFFKRVRTEDQAKLRISSIMSSNMRAVIGRMPLSVLLSERRKAAMDEIQKLVQERATEYGIKVVDVRIIRADLPTENSDAIFQRMESDRTQEAKLFRAEGMRRSQEIKSAAERERVQLIAEAKKEAQISRGEGDAKSIQITAEAFGRDPDFYDFFRSIEAYKKALKPDDTTYVISRKDKFLQHF
jgi:membrane protease subunit HflC